VAEEGESGATGGNIASLEGGMRCLPLRDGVRVRAVEQEYVLPRPGHVETVQEVPSQGWPVVAGAPQ
jgi:hypothetical protein